MSTPTLLDVLDQWIRSSRIGKSSEPPLAATESKMSNESAPPRQLVDEFSAGKYHFRSTTYKDNLAQSLHGLYGQDKFSDVMLCVRGTAQLHLLKTHRFVLAHSSQYFAEIFDQLPAMAINSTPIIIVLPPEVTESVMAALLLYMYKGEASVESSSLSDLLKAGKLLKIRGFEDNQHLMLIDCPGIKTEPPDAVDNPPIATSPLPVSVAPKTPTVHKSLPTVKSSPTPAPSASTSVTSKSVPAPALPVASALTAHVPVNTSVKHPPAGGPLKVTQSTKPQKAPIRFGPTIQTKVIVRNPVPWKPTNESTTETDPLPTIKATTLAAATKNEGTELQVKSEIVSEGEEPGSSDQSLVPLDHPGQAGIPCISFKSGGHVILYKCKVCLTFFNPNQLVQHLHDMHSVPPLKKFKPHENGKC